MTIDDDATREELRAVLDRLADELRRTGDTYPGHLRMLVRRARAVALEARADDAGLAGSLERLAELVDSQASWDEGGASASVLAGRVKGFARALAKAPGEGGAGR